MSRRSFIAAVCGAVVALGLVILPPEVPADGGDSSVVHACVNNRTGRMRIVDPNENCGHPRETPLHWALGGGALGIEIVTAEVPPSTADPKFASVGCPPGSSGPAKLVTGGGAEITGFPAGVRLQQSAPLLDFGWAAQASRPNDGTFDPSFRWGLKVYAICADVR